MTQLPRPIVSVPSHVQRPTATNKQFAATLPDMACCLIKLSESGTAVIVNSVNTGSPAWSATGNKVAFPQKVLLAVFVGISKHDLKKAP